MFSEYQPEVPAQPSPVEAVLRPGSEPRLGRCTRASRLALPPSSLLLCCCPLLPLEGDILSPCVHLLLLLGVAPHLLFPRDCSHQLRLRGGGREQLEKPRAVSSLGRPRGALAWVRPACGYRIVIPCLCCPRDVALPHGVRDKQLLEVGSSLLALDLISAVGISPPVSAGSLFLPGDGFGYLKQGLNVASLKW